MNKNFLNAINDIKKQKAIQSLKKDIQHKETENEQQNQNQQNSKQLKLSKLQLMKKKIMKESKQKKDKDKQQHRADAQLQSKTQSKQSQANSLQIRFNDSPGYDQIYLCIKPLKIYVRQIDDFHITFNDAAAYQKAKQIYQNSGLKFTTKE